MYGCSFPTLTMIFLKDFIEIAALTYACYRWLSWLQADKQKPLVIYFYGYSAVWIASTSLHLTTFLHVLHLTAPLIMTLFVLIHQHTLQKNFIGLYKIKPAQKVAHDWLQEIIRFCLQTQTNVYFLVEHTTSLAELVHAEISMHTPIDHQLLHFLCHAPEFNAEKYLMADTQGNLLGVNTTWKKQLALSVLDEQHIIKASYYLIDSDGCMLHYTHKTRTFTIVIRQKIYPALSAAQVLQSMAHYLRAADNLQGTIRETRPSPSSFQPSA